MYYMRIKTKYNEIKLILEDATFYDEDLQNLLQQEYVREVYLRCIDYEDKKDYNSIKRLVKEKK